MAILQTLWEHAAYCWLIVATQLVWFGAKGLRGLPHLPGERMTRTESILCVAAALACVLFFWISN
jgi:hypothetical protein